MGKKKNDAPEASFNVVPSAPPQDDYHQPHANSSSSGYPSLSSEQPSPQTPVVNSATPPPTYGTTEQVNTSNSGGSYIPQSNPMGPQPSADGMNGAIGTDMPPPSYNDAVNCPAPPYLPYGAPKPNHINRSQPVNPIYPPPLSGTGYVLQAPDNTRGMPQPQVIATTIIASPGPHLCIHCYVSFSPAVSHLKFQGGEVRNETDLCCLLCLILFAIFTFPMGLILLCCIPCTTRRRCMRCRRLN